MERSNIAHKISSQKRTSDVILLENVDFAGLLLSEPILKGLQASGFEKPSPIQLKAIPLGRCGLDLIVQAKSGTGKTCVFSVIALESLELASPALQVLVLAPTREIAVQIQDVIKNIGSCLPRLACHTFIGGLPVKEDINKLKKCHIAIGSPGRVKQLIESGLMKTESIRMFILDEADKLLEESFQEQINWIYSSLPDNKQILALSATYPEYLANHLRAYMRNPTFIRLNISDPALLGIKQYYTIVPHHPLPNKDLETKTKVVIDILSSVTFKQCLIFSNFQTRAQNLCNDLQVQGWPTSCIAGSLDQKDRLAAMNQLKTYQCRVLISTDLTSRGIDADKVDLVINLDVPYDHETYLHRIGRAGRFGSFGAAVSIVSEGKEESELKAVERKCNTTILPLPDPLPVDLVKREIQINIDDMISTEEIATEPSTTGQNILKNDLGLQEKGSSRSQDRHHGDDSAAKCNNSFKNKTSKLNDHSEEMKVQENLSQNNRYGVKENRKYTSKRSKLSQCKSMKGVNQSNNCSLEADVTSCIGSKTEERFSKMVIREDHHSGSNDDDDDDDDDDDETDVITPSGQKFVFHDVVKNQNGISEDMNSGLSCKNRLSKADEKDLTEVVISYQKTENHQTKNKTSKQNSMPRQNCFSEIKAEKIEAEKTSYEDKVAIEVDVLKETKPNFLNSESIKTKNKGGRSNKERLNGIPEMPVLDSQDGNSKTINILSEKQKILQSCQDVLASVQNLNSRIQPPLKDDSKKNHETELLSKMENLRNFDAKEVFDVNYSSSISSSRRDKAQYGDDINTIPKMSSDVQTVDGILKTDSNRQSVDNILNTSSDIQTIDVDETNSSNETLDNVHKTSSSIQTVHYIQKRSCDIQNVDYIHKTSSDSQNENDHRSNNIIQDKIVTENSETLHSVSDLEQRINDLKIDQTLKSNDCVSETSADICKSSVKIFETSVTLDGDRASYSKPSDKTLGNVSETSATLCGAKGNYNKTSANISGTSVTLGDTSASYGNPIDKTLPNVTSATLDDIGASYDKPVEKTLPNLSEIGATLDDTKTNYGEPANISETSAKTCSAFENDALTEESSDKTYERKKSSLTDKPDKLKLKEINYACAVERYNQCKSTESCQDYDYIANICEQMKSRTTSLSVQLCESMSSEVDKVYASCGKHKFSFVETKTQGTETDAILENFDDIYLGANNYPAQSETKYADVYATGKSNCDNFVDVSQDCRSSDRSVAQSKIRHIDNLRNPSAVQDVTRLEKRDNTILHNDRTVNLDSQSEDALNSENDSLDFRTKENSENLPEAQIPEIGVWDPFDLEETKPLINAQTFVERHMKRCAVNHGNKPLGSDLLLRMDWKTIGASSSTTKDDYQTSKQNLKMGSGVSETGLQNSSLQNIKPSLAQVSISTQNGVMSLSDLEESSADSHKEILPPESDSEIVESSSSSCLTSDSNSTPSSDEESDKRCRSEYQNYYWNQTYFHQNVQWPYMDKRSQRSARKAHEDYATSFNSYGHNYPSYMASNTSNNEHEGNNISYPSFRAPFRKAHKDYAIRYPSYVAPNSSSKHQHTSKQSENASVSEQGHGHSKTSSRRTRNYDSSKNRNYAYSYPSGHDVNYYNWYMNQWLPWYQYPPSWQQPFWYPNSGFPNGIYPHYNALLRTERARTVDESLRNMEKLARFQKDYIKMMSRK